MEPVLPLGRHVILDIWGKVNSLPFWNMDEAAAALKKAAIDAGATVMSERWHHFGEGHGYTGVVILAESHISVHTWPEKGYAALDIFMCGKCDPRQTIEPIKLFYASYHDKMTYIVRGEENESSQH
jgi:S-adenosylmethionine decarboxylase